MVLLGEQVVLDLTIALEEGVEQLVRLVGGAAQIMVTASYRFGSASMLAPFDYASMIFATVIGYVAFGDVPTGPILLGASLVIAGGILIIWRERQLGLDRSKSKPNVQPHGANE